MRRSWNWCVFAAIGLCGGVLSSCTSAWLMPTRDAAVDGLSQFVTQSVFDVLDGLLHRDDPGA